MAQRHFAFFDTTSGEYVDDYHVELPDEPPIDRALLGDARLVAMNEWLHTTVPHPRSHCVGLDVTVCNYPVGSFCWMRFDPHARRLDDPVEPHTFVEIGRQSARLHTYWQSPRPVLSNDHTIVVDITGTPLEAHYREHGPMFGQFVVGLDGAIGFQPDEGISGLPATAALKVLESAPIDLTLPIKEAVLVSR